MLPSFPFSNTHFSNHHVVVLDLQPQLLVNSGPPRGPKRRRTTTAGSSFLCSPSSSSLVARPGSPSSSSSSSSANQQISSNDRPSQSSALGNNQSKIPRYAQQTLSYTLKTAQIPERTMNTNSSSKASSKRSITQATGRLDVASTVAVAEQACMPEETSSFSLAISSPSSSTFPTTTASAIPADHSSSSSNSSSSCSNNNNSSKNVVAPQVAVRHAFKTSDIIHDYSCYMFKLKLDNKGSIGALCYLPTQVQNLIEIYHTEVPAGYRNIGLGDLLVKRALEWVKQNRLLIIPTCRFVQRYLRRYQENESCIVKCEQEAIERLASARQQQEQQ